ncbi:protein NODULATION SIGNALING PATHWAY 2-like [Magnolia sinica]|uniref:protein NODULATION SIGNALING PATHWAY 2-like n=1 Tax=Magnolia sinica TaxID=86752 RepID=UPI00265AB1BA|nr:protein NODULATION SIGNALING PATHWAY 2-like [Magnolia sinica]
MRELRQTHFFQMADWCDIDDIGREYYVYQENSSEKGTEKTPKKKKAFQLLRNYISGYKRLRGENLNKSSEEAPQPTKGGRELSTDDVMRIAVARYIQFSLEMEDGLSKLKLPLGSMLSGFSDEETEDVELTHLLLASAEKIGNWQYDQVRNLLVRCSRLGSNVGNPVQRVVHYFTDALRERIDRETGRVLLKGSDGTRWGEGEDVEEMQMGPDPALLACHQLVSIPVVTQFVEIQAIIENMVSAKRIHLIDLGIKVGMQWSILMQALKV